MSIADESAAYVLFEQLRWGGTPSSCPHCGVTGRCYYLAPADGRTRATRTGARSPRRVWKCGACRRQFSVLTGTVFEGTRIALLTWLAAVDTLVTAPPMTLRALAQRLGVSEQSARHIRTRLTAAAVSEPVRLHTDGFWAVLDEPGLDRPTMAR